MANFIMYLIPFIGVTVIVMSIIKPAFFWEHRKALRMRKIFGDKATQIIYLSLGITIIILSVIAIVGEFSKVVQ